MNEINNAYLTIKGNSGEKYTFELSDMQLLTVCKILGCKFQNGFVECYGDNTLKQFLNMKGNPLRLEEK